MSYEILIRCRAHKELVQRARDDYEQKNLSQIHYCFGNFGSALTSRSCFV